MPFKKKSNSDLAEEMIKADAADLVKGTPFPKAGKKKKPKTKMPKMPSC